ncbi:MULTISPECIES: bifunctional protein-serine/threonine kinase/phosphatase [unclassified Roseateles]|uniref:bifunctional protein-serine/threonine kinase/phosphatase n=1 Tax=unclassified Roseateles TaxID=2626991 RepID=UPI0006F77117|nr:MULTISPECIES: bifunctional protein-serine/threonine kinase/phosphatase [unclassified Roseateles]KQW51460.1 serine/threonine protein phosphatase [Pelomonas sp. Root405]KRA77692.1 serine/threonine protein phosphatase [Pelomonas sp. Root662]
MRFELDTGLSSLQGKRPRNEDFAGVQAPAAHEAERGWVAALADGVSGGESSGGEGLMAAQTSVMSLLRDFHAVPADWDTSVALDRLLGHQNAWLAAHNRRPGTDGQPREALTTLTAVALRGRRYALAHVGDSRAWLLRDGQCLLLTQDHRMERRDFAGLTRALGLDDALRLDHSAGELKVGDRLLLTSDGVHGSLRSRQIGDLLRTTPGAQAAADALTAAALAAGSHDNATALVLDIKDLADPGLADLAALGRTLPSPGALGVGATLDGYQVTAVVADNGVHRLLQARELASGRLVALKMLRPGRADDPEERAMLAHEIWLGLRLAEAPRHRRRGGESGFVRVHPPADGATHFYAVFDWHAGHTLEQLLARGLLDSSQAAALGSAVARSLSLLHAAGVVHRDIKPANLHFGDDGQWRVLDLGVALSARAPAASRELHAGTPSYINPEQWQDPPVHADAGSDLFALGVTLYQALTGRLPFGEIEPYQLARYKREPASVSRLQPSVPMPLDRLVMRAVAREARARFETADELLLALERLAARDQPASTRPARPPREVLTGWQIALAVSVLFNLLLMGWLMFLPR